MLIQALVLKPSVERFHICVLHRLAAAKELHSFLDEIDKAVPEDLDVHLVTDDYATHKAPEIKRWLQRRPRYHVHFTPTSSSWLNLIESFFSIVDRRVTRRGVHRSARALERSLREFLEAHNEDPKALCVDENF